MSSTSAKATQTMFQNNNPKKQAMVVHAFNPSTSEAEAGEFVTRKNPVSNPPSPPKGELAVFPEVVGYIWLLYLWGSSRTLGE